MKWYWRWLIALLFIGYVWGVTIKTLRGVWWDREKQRQDSIHAGLMRDEVKKLQAQGWQRDSNGFWQPGRPR